MAPPGLPAPGFPGHEPPPPPPPPFTHTQVLRFYGYFKEAVTESAVENHRVRKVVVFYYLKDDTVQVSEPKQDNSGIPQGIFVKRHRATKPDGAPITPRDLEVGAIIEIYGRQFMLTDADAFTRDFYNVNGSPLAEPVSVPANPLDLYKTARSRTGRAPPKPSNDSMKRFVEAKLGRPSCVLEEDTRKNFLENNRRVLRFYAVWDSRDKLYGERRPYIVHMYLEDNSVEILEVNEPNSGRDPFPLLLRRSPLPKDSHGLDVTVRVNKKRCYGPTDLKVGAVLNVHGRPFLLYDCDPFTKKVLMSEFGASEDEVTGFEQTDDNEPGAPLVIPPWNGYGSFEDSVQNCLSLVPKPPKTDFIKAMRMDRVVLRFVAVLVDNEHAPLSQADASRSFVLSYYMADDTLGIFEPPVRNSGVIGGKFLERQRVYKPHSTETYRAQDFFVGAQAEIFKRQFILTEADEFTMTFMEDHADMFPMADRAAALEAIKAGAAGKEAEVREALVRVGSGGRPVTPAGLGMALAECGIFLVPHEVLSVLRSLEGDALEALANELLPEPAVGEPAAEPAPEAAA